MDINEILKTNKSKINFLKGLIRIAWSDNEVDEKEIIFYQSAAVSLGLSDSEIEYINEVFEKKGLCEKLEFDTNNEKMFFFVQAIQLCWIDNNYSDDEKREIRIIASELNISFPAIEKVENWVREGIEWNKRGEELLTLQ